MKSKRNNFLAFCFSLLPGAGHMYMGFMRQGITLMSTLFLIIGMVVFLRMEVFILVLPILWFYSFFDVHHKRSLSEEDLKKLEDISFVEGDFMKKIEIFASKRSKLLGGSVFILLGLYVIYEAFLESIWMLYPLIGSSVDVIYNIVSGIPSVLIGVAIIYLGYRMILVKKNEIAKDDLFMVEDKEHIRERKETVVKTGFERPSTEEHSDYREVINIQSIEENGQES